jgi:hypothetical protein
MTTLSCDPTALPAGTWSSELPNAPNVDNVDLGASRKLTCRTTPALAFPSATVVHRVADSCHVDGVRHQRVRRQAPALTS